MAPGVNSWFGSEDCPNAVGGLSNRRTVRMASHPSLRLDVMLTTVLTSHGQGSSGCYIGC
jgi:hypothetical protein